MRIEFTRWGVVLAITGWSLGRMSSCGCRWSSYWGLAQDRWADAKYDPML